MFKPAINFNDYVSIAVMLMMAFALVAGNADASTDYSPALQAVTPLSSIEPSTRIDLNGYLGEKALKVSIDIVTDLGHFRGEDE